MVVVSLSAFAVINEDGTVTRLNPKSKTQREAVAKQLLTPNAVMGAVNLHATKRVSCLQICFIVIFNVKTAWKLIVCFML